jgi:ADP-ribose pyrophosphatase YjhB (NUDIX family)
MGHTVVVRRPAVKPGATYGCPVTVPRIDCVGGIVLDESPAGAVRLLLVRRGQEPAKGSWSVPGGRVEPGESDETATAREVLEETALRVSVGRLVGTVERDGPGGVVYVIRDYLCRPESGADLDAVRAGDDADDVGWFTRDQVAELTCSPGLVEALVGWQVL